MSANKTNPSDSPTAWLCVWETAARRGDVVTAELAKRELARLGVHVDWPADQAEREGVAHG